MIRFRHCNPCDDFAICMICEQPYCRICGESADSPHMHLSPASGATLERELAKGELWTDG